MTDEGRRHVANRVIDLMMQRGPEWASDWRGVPCDLTHGCPLDAGNALMAWTWGSFSWWDDPRFVTAAHAHDSGLSLARVAPSGYPSVWAHGISCERWEMEEPYVVDGVTHGGHLVRVPGERLYNVSNLAGYPDVSLRASDGNLVPLPQRQVSDDPLPLDVALDIPDADDAYGSLVAELARIFAAADLGCRPPASDGRHMEEWEALAKKSCNRLYAAAKDGQRQARVAVKRHHARERL